jgi:hypothetical protein
MFETSLLLNFPTNKVILEFLLVHLSRYGRKGRFLDRPYVK